MRLIIFLWRLCPRELRKHVGLVMCDGLRWDCFFDCIWTTFGLHLMLPNLVSLFFSFLFFLTSPSWLFLFPFVFLLYCGVIPKEFVHQPQSMQMVWRVEGLLLGPV